MTEKPKINIREKFIDWSKSSSCHGYHRIFRVSRLSIRILWIISLIISSIFCVYMSSKSIMDYLNYDVVTKTRVHHELPTQFPTVTVCNINPFVTQNASQFIRNIMAKELDLDVLNSTPSTGLLKYIEYAHVLALAERFKPEFKEISRQSFGFLLEDILFRCEFDENDCLNQNSFSKINTYSMGDCFQFNSGFDMQGNRSQLK